MKTLSEHLQNRRETEETLRREFIEKCQKLLDSSADVPLYQSFNRSLKWVRAALAEGRVDFYDLACDHCGTQLVNHEPSVSLASSPPQRRIGCPGCGWVGSIPY